MLKKCHTKNVGDLLNLFWTFQVIIFVQIQLRETSEINRQSLNKYEVIVTRYSIKTALCVCVLISTIPQGEDLRRERKIESRM